MWHTLSVLAGITWIYLCYLGEKRDIINKIRDNQRKDK